MTTNIDRVKTFLWDGFEDIKQNAKNAYENFKAMSTSKKTAFLIAEVGLLAAFPPASIAAHAVVLLTAHLVPTTKERLSKLINQFCEGTLYKKIAKTVDPILEKVPAILKSTTGSLAVALVVVLALPVPVATGILSAGLAYYAMRGSGMKREVEEEIYERSFKRENSEEIRTSDDKKKTLETPEMLVKV